MEKTSKLFTRIRWVLAFTVGFCIFSLFALQSSATAQPFSLGYGFNVAAWDVGKLQEMGFNWMKVFNAPSSKQSVNVLLRVDANSTHFANIAGFRNAVRTLAQNNGAYIDAYEIGNEVNLDASYGWTTAPVAAEYVQLLCTAYEEIKLYDPTAVVVSAGLAPTGRVSGNWNGHAGHNGLYQDEREYLREMIAAGAAACLDAVGYHNYGYSADYDITPDTNGGTPPTNCTNGFCFRGAEKIYEIMASNGLGAKEIWTTEFGWLTDPAAEGLGSCKDNDPGWAGRAWQIVTQEKQAYNLAGAYEYAAAHWPWMGAMFVFNLNFNKAGYYDQCEQMRFYSVQDRPAEEALRNIPKHLPAPTSELIITGPTAIGTMLLSSTLPASSTVQFTLYNTGTASLTYTVTAATTAAVVPTLSGPVNDTLAPEETAVVTAEIGVGTWPTGIYTGTITISTTPDQAGFPLDIPITVYVVEQIYTVNLPLATRP